MFYTIMSGQQPDMKIFGLYYLKRSGTNSEK